MDMSSLCYLEPPAPGGGCGDRSEPDVRALALRDFLVANYDCLHRRLQCYLGCADQASDCLHDAGLRLGDATAAAVHNPAVYIYRVACNLAMDRLRAQRASKN